MDDNIVLILVLCAAFLTFMLFLYIFRRTLEQKLGVLRQPQA